MESLRVTDLTVEFTSSGCLQRLLEGFDLRADSGQLVLVVGPSGSGKTTLLSCLAGIRRPDLGKIVVDNLDLTTLHGKALTAYRRHGVGLVFQSFKLISSLNARENIEVPMRMTGTPRRVARDRAEKLLGEFDLGEHLRRRPGQLSGGQQQRVALARALAHDPPLILADEPTAQLDNVQVEIVLRALRDLARPGRIVIVSTHDRRLEPIADQVIDLTTARKRIAPPRVLQYWLDPGEVLFREGSRASMVFMVDEGEVDLVRGQGEGEELVDRLGVGRHFGELPVLLDLPHTCAARAHTNAIVTGFSITEFRQRLGPARMRAALGRGDLIALRRARTGQLRDNHQLRDTTGS